MSTNLSLKNQGAIISFETFGMLEDYYGHAFNMEHTDLGRKFAWVEVLPIYDADRLNEGYNKHLIIMNDEGYILDLDKDSETGFDESRRTFRERWFYKWLDGYQDMALGYNAICFAEELTPVISTSTKDILKKFAELEDSENSKMTKTQAEEWNKVGLNFDDAQNWINAGFLVSDANFVNWLIKDKATSDVKYKDYDKPEWCLNNLGNGDHKTIEDLRKEFTKV